MATPKKFDLKSMNITEDQLKKLKQVLPEVFTEGLKVDFDRLRQTLGDAVDTDSERFGMQWPGKSECFKVIQQPSIATLKPCEKESVNWESSENLFIEGDNLEVLKLLQKSYYGKVKMIYIDPPYNTGKEFIYPDKYSESLQTYLAYTGQVNDEGIKFSTNTESEGRYHSKWMNMMYPRLFLARNLLRDDGVIFISIDDNEVDNLRKICNDIFGEENFEGHIHWRRRPNQPNDKTKMIGLVAEHILAYSKDKIYLKSCGVGKLELTGDFSNPDNDPRGDWASKPWKVGADQSGSHYKITTPTGKVFDEEWMGEESTFDALIADNRIIWPNKGDGAPRKKYFRSEREEEGQCATNWWPHDQFGHNQGANDEMTHLMGIKNVFSNPKPSELIKNLIALSNAKDGDIILDFFCGAGTTFHSSLLLEYGLKCICVQLPERLNSSNKDQKVGYDFCQVNDLNPNIAEIAKERIRRVIKKIKEDEKENVEGLFDGSKPKQDLGFKVFKLDMSNFRIWDGEVKSETGLARQIELAIDHINPDSKPEDILYEILLKAGFELTTKIAKLAVEGKTVYSIEDNALLVCLDSDLDKEVITAMAKLSPARVVCLDQGFKNNDQLKTNTVQIMKSHDVEDFRTV